MVLASQAPLDSTGLEVGQAAEARQYYMKFLKESLIPQDIILLTLINPILGDEQIVIMTNSLKFLLSVPQSAYMGLRSSFQPGKRRWPD